MELAIIEANILEVEPKLRLPIHTVLDTRREDGDSHWPKGAVPFLEAVCIKRARRKCCEGQGRSKPLPSGAGRQGAQHQSESRIWDKTDGEKNI